MTIATTDTGIAIQKLREMLSESTSFQVEVGATVAAGVLPFIFCPEKRYETEDEQDEQSPHSFAVIVPKSVEIERSSGGGKNYFHPSSGTLELQLIRQIDDFGNLSDELTKFFNFSEGVWGHLIEQSGVDDQLSITAAPRDEVIQSDEKHVAGYKVQKPFHKSTYLISWGV